MAETVPTDGSKGVSCVTPMSHVTAAESWSSSPACYCERDPRPNSAIGALRVNPPPGTAVSTVDTELRDGMSVAERSGTRPNGISVLPTPRPLAGDAGGDGKAPRSRYSDG